MGKHENTANNPVEIIQSTTDPDLLSWLQPYTQDKTLLLLSGGSSAGLAVKLIQQLTEGQQQNLTISLTDERFVPFGDANSNWQLLIDLGLPLTTVKTLPVLLDRGTDIKVTEDTWTQGLQTALRQNIHVLAIFGIGADSHIAGLKPHSPLLHETHKIIGSYRADDWQRITITPVLFEQITSAVIYASGEQKKQAIDILSEDLNVDGYPDQLIKQTQAFKVYYQIGGNT